MTISLSDDARRAIAVAEEVADVTVTDCLIDEEYDRVAFVIAAGEIGTAIGEGGRTVEHIEQRLGTDVTLVEDASTPEAFVANALAPAAVHDVTIETGEDGLFARVDVDDRDVGVAIGADGRRIELARELAARHYDIADVQIE